MLGVRDRRPTAALRPPRSAKRPVLLATFQAPVVAEAAAFAVDSAVESGQPLLVANLIGGVFFPSLAAPAPTPVVTPEVEESLRAPAELAASLGVATERLRVLSPRPLEALLELVAERAAGLVVLGWDPRRMRPRRHAKIVRKLHDRVTCLVWPG